MDDRRLVGIDLGITSAPTVRVLAGDGSLVCRRKAIPTVDSLEQVEQAALAEDADRVTKARPASGPPGAYHAERPRAGTPKVFLWTAPAALGSPCRLGVRLPASARLPLAPPGSCSVAPPAKPRLGALLSSNDYGSSVERTATLHPLWQVREVVGLYCRAMW